MAALFGPVGGHQVDGLETRIEPVGHLELALRLLEPRVARPRLAWRPRAGRGRDPVLEHLGSRVLAEQMMKRGGPGARQSEHEDRATNLDRRDVGSLAKRLLDAQAALEQRLDLPDARASVRKASAAPRDRRHPRARRGRRDRPNRRNRRSRRPCAHARGANRSTGRSRRAAAPACASHLAQSCRA